MSMVVQVIGDNTPLATENIFRSLTDGHLANFLQRHVFTLVDYVFVHLLSRHRCMCIEMIGTPPGRSSTVLDFQSHSRSIPHHEAKNAARALGLPGQMHEKWQASAQ